MRRPGILMVMFGAFDLLAFYRSFPGVIRIFESYSATAYQIITAVLIPSLLVSGPLFMIGNRIGYIIYYFQFPFRLALLSALTFGFIFKLFATQTGTFAYGMVMASVFGLEAVRLMLTIQKNKAMV
jgi:hypothetical protein